VTYYNYLGQAMPESATPINGVYGTSAGGEVLTAPPGPSGVDSGGGGDTLIASNGDNTFWLKDKNDVVQVAAGLTGIKTVVAYSWYTLPAGVHNLISSGARNFAVGNDLNNLIIVGNDAESISGGKGNDVLVGGLGGNTFIVAAGEGNDVIYNFQSFDHVRLLGCAFTTFAQIRSAMTQVGPDVVLRIDPTETLTFRAKTIADFTSNNFLMPLDRSLLGAMTFHDEFDGPQFYDFSNQTGLWRTDFGGPWRDITNYTLPNNAEEQVYVTPSFQGTGQRALGIDPFTFSNGVLTITAQTLTPDQSSAAFGRSFSSGMLTTRGIFEQKYGYFEMRAQLPNTPGTWPAFWMIPDPQNGIEADIMESLGISPNVDFVRAYSPEASIYLDAWKPQSTGFHTYGMLWTPTVVSMYLDDVAVMTIPTPASWTESMYMIVNMALGGWGGAVDRAQLPAGMKIDYVRAWALKDGSSVATFSDPTPPAATIRPLHDSIALSGPGDWTDAKMLTTGGLAMAVNLYIQGGGHTAAARVYNSTTGAVIVPDFDLYGYADVGDNRAPSITPLEGGFWKITFRGYEIHAADGSPRYFLNDYTVGDPLFTPLVGGGEVITDPTWDDVFLWADANSRIEWIPEPLVNGVPTSPTIDEALTNGGFVFSYFGQRQLDVYDATGHHIKATNLGTAVAPYNMSVQALPGGDFAVAWLTPISGTSDTRLTLQTFTANGDPITQPTFVALNRDPWHTQMELVATSQPHQALLLWSEGGAVWGAFANGSTVGQSTTLVVGALGDFTKTAMTDGKVLLTWVQAVPGPDEIWAELLQPDTLQWTRQLLGTGDGDIHVVALPDGGFAASWRDGAVIEARAYDGHGDYGPQTVVSGHFLGLDAAGHVVVVHDGANGAPILEHYEVTPDPFWWPH
jgi:beta-glucanase (GH16 family)